MTSSTVVPNPNKANPIYDVIETELQEVENTLQQLTATLSGLSKYRQEILKTQLNVIRARRDEVRHYLHNLRDSQGDAWQNLRKCLERSRHELAVALAEVTRKHI